MNWSIFNQAKINNCKKSFDPCLDSLSEGELLGKKMDLSDQAFNMSIEFYYVDKHFSNNLQIEKIQDVANAVLKRLSSEIDTGEKWKTGGEYRYNSLKCIVGAIDDYMYDLPRSKRFEYLREEAFLLRVLNRLQYQEEVKIAKSFLNLKKEKLPDECLKEIEMVISSNCWMISVHDSVQRLSEEQKDIYYEFCNEFTLARNKIIYNSLKERLKKDTQARKKNPNAPLSNLVRLSSYERVIFKERIKLSLKIIGSLFLRIILLRDIRNLCTHLFYKVVKKSAPA